jgi:hypothetical protein
MAFIGNGAQLTDLDAGDIASGTLPLARGGTGTTNTVNTVVAGSGISVSTSGTQVTVSSSGGGVTSLNGQTGAITNTDFNAIGSYTGGGIKNSAYGTTNSNTTASGSSIYGGTIDSQISPFDAFRTDQSNSNFSKSGTWRSMGYSKNSGFINKSGAYYCSTNLWVRIS